MKKTIRPLNFLGASSDVAQQLIGALFTVNGIGGIIVETEAYDANDPASHSFAGLTPRNAAMFGPPACVYVYRSYGIHWCLNFVCGPRGHGAGVLIRALEPTQGLDIMQQRRSLADVRLLCAGPGRLGQALAITPQYGGMPLNAPPFQLILPAEPVPIIQGPRIGISKAIDKPWRFGLAGSRFLSRPFPSTPAV